MDSSKALARSRRSINNKVYVADSLNSRIQVFDSTEVLSESATLYFVVDRIGRDELKP